MPHRPTRLGYMRGVRGFNRVADVLPVAIADLPNDLTIWVQHYGCVISIRTDLLAANVHLGRAVDARLVTPIGSLCRMHYRTRRYMLTPGGSCPFRRNLKVGPRAFHPLRADILKQSFRPTFAAKPRFA